MVYRLNSSLKEFSFSQLLQVENTDHLIRTLFIISGTVLPTSHQSLDKLFLKLYFQKQ